MNFQTVLMPLPASPPFWNNYKIGPEERGGGGGPTVDFNQPFFLPFFAFAFSFILVFFFFGFSSSPESISIKFCFFTVFLRFFDRLLVLPASLDLSVSSPSSCTARSTQIFQLFYLPDSLWKANPQQNLLLHYTGSLNYKLKKSRLALDTVKYTLQSLLYFIWHFLMQRGRGSYTYHWLKIDILFNFFTTGSSSLSEMTSLFESSDCSYLCPKWT